MRMHRLDAERILTSVIEHGEAAEVVEFLVIHGATANPITERLVLPTVKPELLAEAVPNAWAEVGGAVEQARERLIDAARIVPPRTNELAELMSWLACDGFGPCPLGQERAHYNRSTCTLTCEDCGAT